jgi:two-component system, sensor histidine kinase LadS
MNLKHLLCLCFFLLSGLVQAQDHITERAWVEDPTGRMTLGQAQRAPATPFTGALSRGYGEGVLWLRLRVDPTVLPLPRNNPAQLVLRMRPVYLDDIQVYDPLAPHGMAGVLGDRYHPRLDAMQGADFLLPVARGDAPRDIWLRLSSTSVRQIHAEVLNMDDLARALQRQYLVFSIFTGVVLVLVVWGLAGWVFQRDSLMGAFAAKQTSALLFGVSSLGFLRLFWPADWDAATLDVWGSVSSLLVVGASLWFHVRFLREYRPAPWAMALLLGLAGGWGLAVLTLVLGSVMVALQVNMLLVLLGPVAGLCCALTGRAWRNPGRSGPPPLPRLAVLGFYAIIVAMLLAASLTALALAPATEWSMYIAQGHGLITGLLLLVLLQYRSLRLNRQRQQDLLALERTSLQAAHEREVREEQGKLMAMLAHEVRSPLSTLHKRLASDTPVDVRQALRDMNAVIDRCIQASRISDNRLEPRMGPLELVGAVHDAVAACSQPHRVSVQAPSRIALTTDRQLLGMVLGNLLENACKYAAPDSPIELVLSTVSDPSRGACFRLELRNQVGASGWPDTERVFDKYYRAPYAQRRAGTGLGLYLVRHLTELLGGRVRCHALPPWLSFEVFMPLNPGWEPRKAAAAAASPAAEGSVATPPASTASKPA